MTGPIRVLLVDDHSLVREGLSLILSRVHDVAVVGHAATGREALRACRELEPDVVVMDIAMPDLNGIEATAHLRRDQPAIRVVVLSMLTTGEHIYQALKAGAFGYLVKNSAGAEVAAAVRAVASGRRYLSREIAEERVEEYAALRESKITTSPLDSLSPREREVLQLVVEGSSSKQIAQSLNLSPGSVDTYRSRLMRKLGVRDVTSLVKLAVAHGLTPP